MSVWSNPAVWLALAVVAVVSFVSHLTLQLWIARQRENGEREIEALERHLEGFPGKCHVVAPPTSPRPTKPLPSPRDIRGMAPGLTGGLPAEVWVRQIRDRDPLPEGLAFPRYEEADAWVRGAEWGQQHRNWLVGPPEKYEFGYRFVLIDPDDDA